MSASPSKEPGRKRLPVLILCSIICLLAACDSGKKKDGTTSGGTTEVFKTDAFDAEEFAELLSAALPAVDTTDSLVRNRKIPLLSTGLSNAYQAHEYLPFWIDKEGNTRAAEQLMNELDSLRWDGIDPERFQVAGLRGRLKELNKSDLPSLISFDTSCTVAYLQASRDLLFGTMPPRKADSLWFHSNDSSWHADHVLAAVLGEKGQYPSLDSFRSRIPTYGLLLKEHHRLSALAADQQFTSAKEELSSLTVPDSVLEYLIHTEVPDLELSQADSLNERTRMLLAYQAHYGVKPSGKLDSNTFRILQRRPDTVARLVRANLERLRWLPQQMEQEYVLVNIPLMELFYKDNGQDAFHMRVVVGRSSRQTPVLNANMANVVFNPPWGVPPTILKKDVLPGIARRGGSYLARKGLRAYDSKGRQVDAGSINASNYRRYSFRQPPGARNALGEIKFNMPNKWDIYLHDTPHREDFPKRDRALSSGCVRVQKPKEFAEFILAQQEKRTEFDQLLIDSLIQTRKTKFENLQTKIPVHLVYLTAFESENGDGIRYLGDIYKRDRKLMAQIW